MLMLNQMVHKLGSDIDGHLMMDETKLRNIIMLNCINNGETEFL